MITWKDFILDDFLGPVLADIESCREWVSSGVEEGGRSSAEETGKNSVQETRQGQQPARMVGGSSLKAVRIGMEADKKVPNSVRPGGEG